LQESILLAVAMLRDPEAVELLLALVGSEDERHGLMALSALKIHRHDDRLRERVAQAVAARDSRTLRERFDREFRADD
jgi:hypothetical protein